MLPDVKHVIIYVPGLGDARIRGQRLAIRTWLVYGVDAYMNQMNWADGSSFESKFERLLTKIDELHQQNCEVSLVGVSAGASAVLNAYAERSSVVHRVVLLCGKVQNAQTISSRTYDTNPAFRESMEMLPRSLSRLNPKDLDRILTVYPLADTVVPVQDTKLGGAHETQIPTRGHFFSIAFGITLGSYILVRFIKRYTKD